MIKCPKCTSPDSRIERSHYQDQWNQLRHVRVCKSCGHNYRTYENVDDDGSEG